MMGVTAVDAQLKKGLLDACVLASISREDAYGYRITQDTIAALDVSESALYPALRRLEKQGCFETYSREYGGRLRKYYRITPLGLQRLEESRAGLREVERVIKYILGDTENLDDTGKGMTADDAERISDPAGEPAD
jgi:PadR family transcriptional regulator PadR